MTYSGGRGQRVVLARRPCGELSETDFDVEEVSLPAPKPGELQIASKYLSIDPYVRCLVDESSPYGSTLSVGQQITGDAVSVVMVSTDRRFSAGSWVIGRTGWSTVSNVNAQAVRPLESWITDPSAALSSLGNTGLTAFIGVTMAGPPKIGDTALVSGAGGGVGTVAVQLLKLAGCDVIGIAGGPRKAKFLSDELAISKVIDRRITADLSAEIGRLAPDGINIYFDNVGGEISQAVFDHLAVGARIVLCGEVSQYDAPGREYNPRLYGPLMAKRASVAAFLVSDFKDQFGDLRKRLHGLLMSGKLKDVRDIVDGIEAAPRALINMMKGENLGKRLVRL